MALAAYWPCLRGAFVWDDTDWTTGVEWLMRDRAGLWQIWTNPTVLQQYYPVTSTSFWIDHQLWGWNTLPFHLENVLLHGLSCVLFWRVLLRLEVAGAWFAAALFAVHPVMAESVAWITERKNVLSLVLSLTALLAYGRFCHWWKTGDAPRSRTAYALALLFFAGALLAKITAYVLPPALLVIAWWKHGNLRWRRDVLPTLPMFAAAVIAGIGIGWLEKHHVGARGEDFDIPFANQILVAGQALWFYAGKLLWPHPLCVIYHRWALDASSWRQWLAPAGVVVLAVLLAWRGRRGVIAAALLFAGALFPVLGFMNVYGMRFAWVADRWVYLPSLVVLALVGEGVAAIRSAVARRLLATILLAACGVLTWRQAAAYRNIDTFWTAAIRGNPTPWKAHNDYGTALMEAKRGEEALQHLREAVRLAPDVAAGHSNLGNALVQLGRNDEAIQNYERALALRPDLAPAHYNIAVVLGEAGRTDEAEKHYRKALELDPKLLGAHGDLGNLLLLSGRLDEAEQHYRRALELRPNDPSVNTSLGNIRYRQGRLKEALRYFELALAADPNLVAALSNSAWIMATTADASIRHGKRAVELAERAVRLTRGSDPAHLHALAAAYAEAGRFSDAKLTADKAIPLAEARGDAGIAVELSRARQLYEANKPSRADSP